MKYKPSQDWKRYRHATMHMRGKYHPSNEPESRVTTYKDRFVGNLAERVWSTELLELWVNRRYRRGYIRGILKPLNEDLHYGTSLELSEKEEE